MGWKSGALVGDGSRRLAEWRTWFDRSTGLSPVLFWRGCAAAIALVLFASLTSVAFADEGSLTNSGGSASGGAGYSVSSSTTTPSGTLSLNCPGGSTGSCSGGSLTYASSDGTSTINASFSSGTFAEGCSGGGKGGHVNCSWSLTGYFSGALTVNGVAQAINGVTYQAYGTSGVPDVGTTTYNSAYTPFYYSDSEQILRSDDLQGTNQITYGSQGSGVGQFYGAYGIALDSKGRIYVADTYNCRIVRIDDMKGTNWISYGGTCGTGPGQFADPEGIAVDSSGRLYVADTGNARIVRMDDMTGSNWDAYTGSSASPFASGLTSIAIDSSNRIYVADTGNLRIVRFDDMTGTNWTALTQSQPVNGATYTFQSPTAVAVDAAGKIYVADDQSYQPAVVRVDDMTGANWTWIYTGAGAGLNSIAVDPSGIVIAGGGGARIVDSMAGVLTSSGSIGPIGTYYVFGVTPIPMANPRPSAVSFSSSTLSFSQNAGTTSDSQAVTVTNFGGSPLNLSNITASSGFAITPTCPSVLTAGATCSVGVTFTPTATGTVHGQLSFSDSSGNLGTTQSITLTGLGTLPAVSLTPTKVSFVSQLLGTTSRAKNVTVLNSGNGPLQITNVAVSGPFSQTNTCASVVAPNASCTISVSFTPTVAGSATGTLTITDNAADSPQTVILSGTGRAPLTITPSSLNFRTVAVGTTSATKSVILVNATSATITFSSIIASPSFAIASNTCGTSLAAGSSCTVGVSFSPTTSGAITGMLTVTDDAVTSPQTVSLSGTGR